jgi:hypothetical protein
MSLRLALLKHATAPAQLKTRLLDELALVTAAGFACDPPQWSGPTYETRLADYVVFTTTQAELLLAGQDASAIDAARDRLWRGAERLGARLRRQLGVRRDDDALAALAVLYHHLGIEMEVDQTGGHWELRVTKCGFAGSFSEPMCRVVAGLDEGIAAGLSAGGRLEFVTRITGGHSCCRARFEPAARP